MFVKHLNFLAITLVLSLGSLGAMHHSIQLSHLKEFHNATPSHDGIWTAYQTCHHGDTYVSRVYVASFDQKIKLGILAENNFPVNSFAWSFDDQYLAVLFEDLNSFPHETSVKIFKRNEHGVFDLQFSVQREFYGIREIRWARDNKTLFCLTRSGLIQKIDVETKLVTNGKNEFHNACFACSADARDHLVGSGSTLYVNLQDFESPIHCPLRDQGVERICDLDGSNGQNRYAMLYKGRDELTGKRVFKAALVQLVCKNDELVPELQNLEIPAYVTSKTFYKIRFSRNGDYLWCVSGQSNLSAERREIIVWNCHGDLECVIKLNDLCSMYDVTMLQSNCQNRSLPGYQLALSFNSISSRNGTEIATFQKVENLASWVKARELGGCSESFCRIKTTPAKRGTPFYRLYKSRDQGCFAVDFSEQT